MEEYKIKLLDYIEDNYDDVVVEAVGGPYLRFDLIPDGDDDKNYQLIDVIESYRRTGFDQNILTHSYELNKTFDGLRENRWFYIMQATSKVILDEFKNRQRSETIKKVLKDE